MKIFSYFRAVISTLALLMATHVGAAPTLLVNSDGLLTGAKNVDVGGTLYDVAFRDGTCLALFNNCTEQAFAFQTYDDAGVAAQALLDQVLIDGPLGLFDSVPNAVAGCRSDVTCSFWVPHGMDPDMPGRAAGRTASNNADEALDRLGYGWASFDWDSNVAQQNTWAVFSLAATSEVPEPGTVSLVLAALLGLGLARHRRQRRH